MDPVASQRKQRSNSLGPSLTGRSSGGCVELPAAGVGYAPVVGGGGAVDGTVLPETVDPASVVSTTVAFDASHMFRGERSMRIIP
jgi:hypothetical protein